jgi:hypothetical protein
MLLAACQDNQTAGAGFFFSAYTAALLDVWQDGEFDGDYHDLTKAIARLLPDDQVPNLFAYGLKAGGFERQRPFRFG